MRSWVCCLVASRQIFCDSHDPSSQADGSIITKFCRTPRETTIMIRISRTRVTTTPATFGLATRTDTKLSPSRPTSKHSLLLSVDQTSVSGNPTMTINFRTSRLNPASSAPGFDLACSRSSHHKDIFNGVSVTFEEKDFRSNLCFNLDKDARYCLA